jgi:hypothetical protein
VLQESLQTSPIHSSSSIGFTVCGMKQAHSHTHAQNSHTLCFAVAHAAVFADYHQHLHTQGQKQPIPAGLYKATAAGFTLAQGDHQLA